MLDYKEAAILILGTISANEEGYLQIPEQHLPSLVQFLMQELGLNSQ